MPRNRWNSIEVYHTMVAIEALVADLVCKGEHDDGTESYLKLKYFVQAEREALSVRAAQTMAELARRSKIQERKDARG